jgi:hypothetical protein
MELRIAPSQHTGRPLLAVPSCPTFLARTSRLQSQPANVEG